MFIVTGFLREGREMPPGSSHRHSIGGFVIKADDSVNIDKKFIAEWDYELYPLVESGFISVREDYLNSARLTSEQLRRRLSMKAPERVTSPPPPFVKVPVTAVLTTLDVLKDAEVVTEQDDPAEELSESSYVGPEEEEEKVIQHPLGLEDMTRPELIDFIRRTDPLVNESELKPLKKAALLELALAAAKMGQDANL